MLLGMQADRWYRQLLRSHEMMQQLVGGGDPASPLEVDWDTASGTSAEQAEDEKPSGMLKPACFLYTIKLHAMMLQ